LFGRRAELTKEGKRFELLGERGRKSREGGLNLEGSTHGDVDRGVTTSDLPDSDTVDRKGSP